MRDGHDDDGPSVGQEHWIAAEIASMGRRRRPRRFTFGYSDQQHEWRIETPNGVVRLIRVQLPIAREGQPPRVGETCIRIEVEADGDRFPDRECWAEVHASEPGGRRPRQWVKGDIDTVSVVLTPRRRRR